jgi:hypothetical protein
MWLVAPAPELVRGGPVVAHNNLYGDVINMGAIYTDEDVVVDGDLVTGRSGGHCHLFAHRIVEMLAREGRRPERVDALLPRCAQLPRHRGDRALLRPPLRLPARAGDPRWATSQIVFLRNGRSPCSSCSGRGRRRGTRPPRRRTHGPARSAPRLPDRRRRRRAGSLAGEAEVTLGPLDFGDFIPGWRTAWVRDPDGVIVEISQGYVDQQDPPGSDG